MYYSLNGRLLHTDAQTAAVECGGVGYKCYITHNTRRNLPETGKNVLLYTYLAVREDALDLYGFSSLSELECFKLIITVNGVGARLALSVLSELTPEQLSLFVATGDAKSLTRAPGVGLKLAQRMVLELKDKLGSLGSGGFEAAAVGAAAAAEGSAGEAVAALAALGYSQSEAALAVGGLDLALPVEELVRLALKSLASRS